MYTEAAMKKTLGKARWEKVADYDYSGGVIDIAFKLPWIHPQYVTTVWVCEPGYYDMTKKEIVDEAKDFIDNLVHDWDLCPYNPDGTMKGDA